MAQYYSIALSETLDSIDVETLTQAVTYQFPYVDIVDNHYDIMVTSDMIGDGMCRIGHCLDIIEKNLFENRIFEVIDHDKYKLDWQKSILYIQGKSYRLSERERDLLTELILAQDAGCNKNYLLNKIWGFKAELETHALETQIYRLRQKIEDNPENPIYLITTTSGYKLA